MKDRIFVIAENANGNIAASELYNMLRLYGWTPNVDLFMTKDSKLTSMEPELQEKLFGTIAEREKEIYESKLEGRKPEQRFKKVCFFGVREKQPLISEDIEQDFNTDIKLTNMEALIIMPSPEKYIGNYNWIVSAITNGVDKYNKEETKRILAIIDELKRTEPKASPFSALTNNLNKVKRLMEEHLRKIVKMEMDNKEPPKGSMYEQTFSAPELNIEELKKFKKQKDTALQDITNTLIRSGTNINNTISIQFKNNSKLITDEDIMKNLLKQNFDRNIIINGYQKDGSITIITNEKDDLISTKINLLDFIGETQRVNDVAYDLTLPTYTHPNRNELIYKIIGADLKGLESIIIDKKNERIFGEKNMDYIYNELKMIQLQIVKEQISNNEDIQISGKSYSNATKWLKNTENSTLDKSKLFYLERVGLSGIDDNILKMDNKGIDDVKRNHILANTEYLVKNIELIEKIASQNEAEFREFINQEIQKLKMLKSQKQEEYDKECSELEEKYQNRKITYSKYLEKSFDLSKMRSNIFAIEAEIRQLRLAIKNIDKEQKIGLLKSFLGLTEDKETKQENIDAR